MGAAFLFATKVLAGVPESPLLGATSATAAGQDLKHSNMAFPLFISQSQSSAFHWKAPPGRQLAKAAWETQSAVFQVPV